MMRRTALGLRWPGLALAIGCSVYGCSSADPPGSEAATGGGGQAATGGSSNGSGGFTSGTGGSASGAGGSASGTGGAPSGSGGSPNGTGGAPNGSGGSTAGTGGATGGSSGSGGDGAAGASGAPDMNPDDGPPAAPEGQLPNDRRPEGPGLISDTLEFRHHNQPSVINGYLQLSGNALISLYDLSDPTAPELLAFRESPGHCQDGGCGEAEGHQVSFAKYGSTFYTATIRGKGIDIWDITDVRDPKHVKAVDIPGVNYGDFTEAVWGVAWQGTTIYVGGTNTGVHVIDATDPANATLVKSVPQGQVGNVNAGPLFAIGNLLVVTTPKDNRGVATLDISSPHQPMILDSVIPQQNSYIGWFYRHHVYLLNPIRVYDVLSDPTDITQVNGNRPGGYWEYMSFQDGYMFAGRIRPNPGADKIDVSDLSNFVWDSSIVGRRNLSGNADPENDDQFTVAIGNLLVLSDDQLHTVGPNTGKAAGTVIAVHDVEPDTTPPYVDTIIPKDGATGQPVTTRVGISFTDNVELATVDTRSFIVRPIGGQALPGTFSVTMSVLNFDPAEPLQPNTTYEVVLPAGGVKDYVGNGMAEEFRSTFTTQ